MSKRSGVQFVQNDEPAFIRQFKEKVGYKEGPNVDTKRQRLEYQDDDEDRPETEDEKPIVVVLKSGDLTETEADELTKAVQKQEEEQAIRDGKITFKKPVKKGDDSPQETSGTDVAKQPAGSKGKGKDKKKKDKEKKTSNLLSFGDEEEEED